MRHSREQLILKLVRMTKWVGYEDAQACRDAAELLKQDAESLTRAEEVQRTLLRPWDKPPPPQTIQGA